MTENKLTPFLFEGDMLVRVIMQGGAPWFVATDVCHALGIVNPADAIEDLDDDEKGIGSSHALDGHLRVIIVSESGLYALIFKSRKPDAAKFRKWVTAEVLPSVRQTSTSSLSAGPVTGKPYDEWTLEEIRLALTQVDTARKALGRGGAAWMWEHVGLPMPPARLLPGWWQPDLYIPMTPSA